MPLLNAILIELHRNIVDEDKTQLPDDDKTQIPESQEAIDHRLHLMHKVNEVGLSADAAHSGACVISYNGNIQEDTPVNKNVCGLALRKN